MDVKWIIAIIMIGTVGIWKAHAAEVWVDCTFAIGQNPCSDENAHCYIRGPESTAICRCNDGYVEDKRDPLKKKCVRANGRWLNCDAGLVDRNCTDPNARCPSSGRFGADCRCLDGFVIDARRFNDWRCVKITDDMQPFKCSKRPPPCARKNYAFKYADCYCLPDL